MERQALETVRQILGAWHVGAADQHWNGRDAALQCGLHLDTDGIVLVVNAAISAAYYLRIVATMFLRPAPGA